MKIAAITEIIVISFALGYLLGWRQCLKRFKSFLDEL